MVRRIGRRLRGEPLPPYTLALLTRSPARRAGPQVKLR